MSCHEIRQEGEERVRRVEIPGKWTMKARIGKMERATEFETTLWLS